MARDIFSEPFERPNRPFEAPWGYGKRPLTEAERNLYEPTGAERDAARLAVAESVASIQQATN
jgi:hypothetical protein